MAKLKLAFVVVFFLCFLSRTSSEISKSTEVAPGDIAHDDLIVFPSSSSNSQLTILPESDSKSESSSELIPVDLTDVKEEMDDLPNSSPFKVVSFHHHHHQDEDSDEDRGLRKSHHHHDDDESDDDSDDEDEEEEHKEVAGVEKGRVGPPLGHWLRQRKTGGEEEHPFHHEFLRHRRHHHHDDEEEEKEHGEVEGVEKERVGLPLGHWIHQQKIREQHGEVEAVEKERVGPPLGHWIHQQKYEGEEEHPFHHKSHDRRHHHHRRDDDEKEEELGEVEAVEKERVGPPLGHWIHQQKYEGEEEHPFPHKSHHSRRHHHHHRDDDEKEEEHGEIEAVGKERVGPPLGHWIHQQKYEGEEEHPFHHRRSCHHHHHHDDSDEEEEKRGKGGVLFKLRKFLDVF